MKKTALVTGAYRDLGLETARQLAAMDYTVLMTARKDTEGEEQAVKLRESGFDAHYVHLDVGDPKSIGEAYQSVIDKWKKVDVLVNNAAIFDRGGLIEKPQKEALSEQQRIFLETYQINVIGAFQLCELFVPLMVQNGYGRVVNVSSSWGQLQEMGTECPAYRISKTGLNAVTRMFARYADKRNVLVNSVCPGWVKTDMGGFHAERELKIGVQTIVWAATLEDSGPTGGFFRDCVPIEW